MKTLYVILFALAAIHLQGCSGSSAATTVTTTPITSVAQASPAATVAAAVSTTTDYSVGIDTNATTAATRVNLYAISATGITLIQQYILQQNDWTGNLARALTLAMNPAHTFVYVAYSGPSQPIIAGFSITPAGLVYEWQQELQTADSGLQGTTLVAGSNYVIEYTYPALWLWVHVINQSGQEIMVDAQNAYDDMYVVAAKVDPSMSYYYSCRSPTYPADASLVAVFALTGADVSTMSATPVGVSSDAAFIASVCA